MRRGVTALSLGAALAAAGAAFGQGMPDMPGMDQAPSKPQTSPAQAPASASPQQPRQAPAPKGDGSMPGMRTDQMDMDHMDMGRGEKGQGGKDQGAMGQGAMGQGGMAHMTMSSGMSMMTGMLGAYPMTQDGSGTSWQPASTPMQGLMWSSGDWSGMVHGYADLVYDQQNGPRGATETFSESMLMAMAQHAEGPGTLTLKTMLSLDPAMGPSGYPLLLQTGETANGVTPLVDRQHPHNLFMELAGVYSLPVAPGSSAFLYVGYPGEPALGPVTFMHRFSGEDDPAAPITHHWLDSTHISYGVVTTGFVHGPFKIETSVFNGREPDQHRWDYQQLRLDSWSGRLSWNPGPNWAFQTSYGYLHSPEQLTPSLDEHRLTASGAYNRPFTGGNWQTTFAWGRNYEGPGHTLDGLLLESAVAFGRQTVFARAENVQKDDLFFGTSPFTGQVFRVSEATLGYVYDIPVAAHVAFGLGLQGTVNFVPSPLRAVYGSEDPTGWMPFLRLKLR